MTGHAPRVRPFGSRFAAWLGRRLLSAADAHRLLGALDDEFSEFQEPGSGRFRASTWYWRQLVRSIRDLRASDRRPGLRRPHDPPAGASVRNLAYDLRLASRAVRRIPGFSLLAVGTLALGIGATTAVFSVVDAVLLRPLPYPQPDRIVRAWAHEDDGGIEHFSFKVLEYQALARQSSTFAVIGAEYGISISAAVPGADSVHLQGRLVTPQFFSVFGTGPVIGRMFTADEIAGGTALVALVSHRFWTRHLGADPAALDQPLDLDGRPYRLIGVLPETYHHVSGEADVFVPYTIGTSRWTGRWLHLFGRVNPGASLTQIEDEVSAAMAAVRAAAGGTAGWHASVERLHDSVVGGIRPAVLATFAAVGLVLLIACVNVANLTLARGASRSHEIALRVALGASRARVVQQLFAESLLLAAAGILAGAGVAWCGLRVLISLAPASIPRIADAAINPAALVFSMAATGVASVAFGFVPALRMTRRGAALSGHQSARTTVREARFGGPLGALVIAEVALALALLVGAGLMVRTYQALATEEFGFRPDATVTFTLNVPAARWPGAEGVLGFYDRLRDALLAIPGVTAVGAGTDLPLGGQGAVASVTSEARARAGGEALNTLQRRATVGYFEALGTPLVAGRTFDRTDGPDTPTVAVISASLAQVLFPGEDAVGKRIGFGNQPDSADWKTVVGVVADMRFERADRVDFPQIYQAHTQSATREMSVAVRTSSSPGAMLDRARSVVAMLDASIPIYNAATLEEAVSRAVAAPRFTMSLFSMFAVVALLLAAAGIYGVIAFAVGRRRRELGVRLALGARPADVVRLVVGQGMAFVTIGLVAGLLIAVGAARAIEGLVYGVPATDWLTYTVVTAVLAAAGFGACYVPASRGARLDPARTLRSE